MVVSVLRYFACCFEDVQCAIFFPKRGHPSWSLESIDHLTDSQGDLERLLVSMKSLFLLFRLYVQLRKSAESIRKHFLFFKWIDGRRTVGIII